MALNRNDIQILKEVFQPYFDRIDERFEQIDKRFEQVDKRFVDLEDRMNKRFEDLENNLVRQFVAEIYNLYTPRDEFKLLEKRVTTMEDKLHRQSS